MAVASGDRVACCVDGPEAGPALDVAVGVSARAGARLSLVHVAESPGRFSGGRTAWTPPEDELAAGIVAEARDWLEPLAAAAGGAEAVVLQGPDPAEEILAWAREAGCGLLVVHPRRRGVARRVLGGVTTRLASDAPCPVLVVPDAPEAAAGT
jgi:nucleotide-binding universal stress UspA family protein